MFWIPMMIGAAGGALMNKKDPLKGALMGAGIGAAGGTALGAMGGSGGLLGSGAATGQGVALEAMYGGVAPEVAAGMGATANAGAGVPIIEQGIAASAADAGRLSALGKTKGLLGTAGTALNVANQVKGLTSNPTPPPQLSPNVPNPTMANMYNEMVQNQQQRLAMEKQLRQMRRNRMMG